MVVILSQPQLVPLTPTSLTGFITLRNKAEFYLSVDYSSCPPSVECDDALQNILSKYPAKLSKLVSESRSLPLFIQNLVEWLEEVCQGPINHHNMLRLIKQISLLPSEAVKSIDKDFRQITLQCTDDGDRTHCVSIQLDQGSGPILTCDLPEPLTLPTSDGMWSCQDVLKLFRGVVEQFQGLWDTLDIIDQNCWVVEPEPFSRGTLHRRIVLKEDVSLIVTLDPAQPTILPRCRFLGSARAIQPFQNLLDERGEVWEPGESLLDNLTTILEVALPPKPAPDSSQSDTLDCGVCYCHEMEGEIPEVGCNNETCRQLYHVTCLVEWLRGLPGVRQSFGTIFGECPYCSKPMHVQAVL